VRPSMPHLGGAFFMSLQKIIEAHRAGEMEIAVKGYYDHIAREIINSNVITLLASALFQKGNIEEAEFILNKYQNIEFTLNDKLKIATLYLLVKQPKKSEEIYRTIKGEHPFSIEIEKGLAASLIELKKYEEAIKILQEAFLKEKKDIDIIYNLALAFQKLKKYSLAISYYEQILIIDKNHHGSVLNLISLYSEVGLFYKAFELYENFKINNKIDEGILFSYCYALKKSGKLQEALIILGPLLDKQIVNALKLAAAIKIETNDQDSALLLFQKILNTEIDIDILRATADILMDKKQFKETFELYKIANKIEPKNPRIHSGLLNIMKNICEWEEIDHFIELCLSNSQFNPLTALAITDNKLLLKKFAINFIDCLEV
jgi:tetratricopeptide (TPR) repeat protein